jgi:hypothetical protein
MRLRMNDERDRRLEALLEASGENTKSKTIDSGAKYYVRMSGGTGAVPDGKLAELVQLAEQQGSVTPAEIADVLDTEELLVVWESNWSVGD